MQGCLMLWHQYQLCRHAVNGFAGSKLVKLCIEEMIHRGCQEVVLEAEVTNIGALKLYQNLGFIRDKRLRRCVGVHVMMIDAWYIEHPVDHF